MKTHKSKLNIPMCIACVLFCLTLFSVHFAGNLYARYVTTDDSSDSARVAVMATDVSLEIRDNIPVCPGEYTVIPVTISNFKNNRVCEVAQCYVMTVNQLEDNIPFVISVYSDADCTTTVTPEGYFSPSVKESVTYYVKVDWPSGSNSAFYAFEIDAIEIDVRAEQID